MKQNVGYNLLRPLSTRRSAPHLVKPLHTTHYGLIGTDHVQLYYKVYQFQAHFILYVVLFQKFIKPQTNIFFLLALFFEKSLLMDPRISTTARYKTLLAPVVTCTLVQSLFVTVLFALHDSGPNIGIAYTPCQRLSPLLLDHGRKWLGGMAKPMRAT
jgi:hypothetical protein